MGILVDVNNPSNMLQRREVEAAAGKLGGNISLLVYPFRLQEPTTSQSTRSTARS